MPKRRPRSAPVSVPKRARPSWRNLDWELIKTILAIKFLVLALGAISFKVWQNQTFNSLLEWLNVWNRWDATHYQNIAQHGYQAIGEARFLLVFFPLYPLLVRLVAFLAGDYVV